MTQTPHAAATRPLDRLSWLWLAAGVALLPFTTVHAELPLAAWLAPVFILRFTRTQSVRVGLPVVVLLSGAAIAFAWRDFFPVARLGIGPRLARTTRWCTRRRERGVPPATQR